MGIDVGGAAVELGRCGRTLRHPVFVVAVALLLLNARWWKAAAPGLVTGKLSDLAGVVVASVLMTVTLVPWMWARPQRSPRVRGVVGGSARMVATLVVLGAGFTATTATSCSDLSGVDAVVPGEGGLLLALSGGSTVAWSPDQGEHWVSTTTTEVVEGPTTSIVVAGNGSEYVVRDKVFVGEDGSVLPAPTEPDAALGPSFADEAPVTVPTPPVDLAPSTEACIEEGCWRVAGGAVVRADAPDDAEFAALENDGDACGQHSEVRSLVAFDRPDGPVLVALVEAQGIAVNSGDGRWERMPIAGTALPTPAPPSIDSLCVEKDGPCDRSIARRRPAVERGVQRRKEVDSPAGRDLDCHCMGDRQRRDLAGLGRGSHVGTSRDRCPRVAVRPHLDPADVARDRGRPPPRVY